MAANVNPIFPLTPKSAWGVLQTANTAKDGTGTVVTICTASASGDYIDDIRCMPTGTNTASVLRVFLNNGSTNTTATNNTLWYEASLPATTLTEVAAQTPVIIPLNRTLPSGYKLNVTIGTTVAATWHVTCGAGGYV